MLSVGSANPSGLMRTRFLQLRTCKAELLVSIVPGGVAPFEADLDLVRAIKQSILSYFQLICIMASFTDIFPATETPKQY